MRALGLLLVLLVACGGSSSEPARAQSPGYAPGPASANAPAPEQAQSWQGLISFRGEEVLFEGRPVTRFARSQPRPNELEAAVRRYQEGCSGCLVRVAVQADTQWYLLVWTSHALLNAQVATVQLELDGRFVRLALVRNIGRGALLIAEFRPAGIEVLGVPSDIRVEQLDPTLVPNDAGAAGLAAPVLQFCASRGCGFILVAAPSRVAAKPFVELLTLAQGSSQPEVSLVTHDAPFAKPGEELAGSLAPESIQAVVRSRYDAFHGCYERGLSRDPALQGKVVVHFVIDRDGTVSDAALDFNPAFVKSARFSKGPRTTLPDDVVNECVIQAYRRLKFPRPVGGKASVVYPIAFSPG